MKTRISIVYTGPESDLRIVDPQTDENIFISRGQPVAIPPYLAEELCKRDGFSVAPAGYQPPEKKKRKKAKPASPPAETPVAAPPTETEPAV